VGIRAVLDAVAKRKIPNPCRDSNVNILGGNINTIKKNKEALLQGNREDGPERNGEETKYMVCIAIRTQDKITI
jgi:hypothetical protein